MILNFIPAMSKEEMEMQLWAYIDKQCSDADRQRIDGLIANDAAWKSQYDEFLAFHNELATADAEQPSMRFSRNLMEAIGSANIAPASRNYVNRWVIRGITASFVLLLIVTIGYSLANINWHSSGSSNIKLSNIPTGTWLPILISVNIILVIVFIDLLIKGRRAADT